VEKIGDGVWFLTLGNPQSILVEFGDHVVIIEAPTNDDRTLATIAEVKKMVPAKAIKYVVNTHHHFDHAGGLRAYVAEGIPILTHATHKRYYEQEIFKNPHTLYPDRLARAPRAPIIETVDDKRILTDGRMSLELHLVRGNLHSDGLLMAYIPRDRVLIEVDAFSPGSQVNPYTANLLENIQKRNLRVDKIVPLHGTIAPFAELVKVSGGKTN
jgi:glyoxylase-like metal-dependent hydrolase (beta-lactamase superfamily II)